MNALGIKKALAKIKYGIFPSDHVCYMCGGFCEGKRDMLCTKCGENFLVSGNTCIKCGRPTKNTICTNCNESSPKYDGGVSVFYYEGKARSSLLSFKNNMHRYKARLYAEYIFRAIEDKKWDRADYIVYVPGSIRRNIKRGYNPSKIIADLLGMKLDIPCLRRSLTRKYTQSLTRMGRLQRIKAVADMYDYGKNIRKIVGKSVILIDDVLTTGSTLGNCAALLSSAGAKDIRIASVFVRRD